MIMLKFLSFHQLNSRMETLFTISRSCLRWSGIVSILGLTTSLYAASITGPGPSLNGNNVWNGTNAFAGTKTTVDTFTVDDLTRERILYRASTNIYISSVYTNSNADMEVNGGYSKGYPIFEGLIPALSSSNALVQVRFVMIRPQATLSGFSLAAYVGTNTNYWGISGSIGSGGARGTSYQEAMNLLTLEASFSIASGQGSFGSGTAALLPISTNLAGDLSQPWMLRICAFHTAGNNCTNVWLSGFRVLEKR